MARQELMHCWKCNAPSVHQEIGLTQSELAFPFPQKVRSDKTIQLAALHHHLIYQCPKCKHDTYVLKRLPGKSLSRDHPQESSTEEILYRYPSPSVAVSEHIPDEVRRAAHEAELCLSVRANNACAVMARLAMECMCRDKGANGKDLFEMLGNLKGKIPDDLLDWANDLRVLGKIGAHADYVDVSLEDAEYATNFMREVLKYVYVLPAERASKKVTAKKKTRTST